MSSFSIPHIPLTEETKTVCCEIMRAGNSLLKKKALAFYRKQNCASRFRRGLHKWSVNPDDPEAINPRSAKINKKELAVIMKVTEVEFQMISGHVKLVRKMANRYDWASQVSYLDLDDLRLEGLIALRDSVYSYDRDDAEFITYAYWAIRRRLLDQIRKASDLGAFTEDNVKLLERFNIQKGSLQQAIGGTVSFDTVAHTLRLNLNQKEILQAMFTRFVRESQLPTQESRHPFLGNLMQKVNLDREEVTLFREAMERVKLTPLERELVEAALSGDRESTQIVSRYTNPKTNRPYSRMSATNMRRSAFAKIKRQMRRMESAA